MIRAALKCKFNLSLLLSLTLLPLILSPSWYIIRTFVSRPKQLKRPTTFCSLHLLPAFAYATPHACSAQHPPAMPTNLPAQLFCHAQSGSK